MRCPQCGYIPARDNQQAEKELNSYLLGWTKDDAKCLTTILGPQIRQLEQEHYHQDLLNFLRRMAREGFNSEKIIDHLYLFIGDEIYMDKLRRADRPWPYIGTSMVRRKKSDTDEP